MVGRCVVRSSPKLWIWHLCFYRCLMSHPQIGRWSSRIWPKAWTVRIARPDGESHWITGDADLDHTHRLRSVCDAVLVGANTVQVDDCKLTVRRCTGENPLRVVLDPAARVSPARTIFRDAEAPTLWIVGDGQPTPVVDGDFEVEVLPCADGHIATSHVLELLQARGIKRLFVEGGGVTVFSFFAGWSPGSLAFGSRTIVVGGGARVDQRAIGAQFGCVSTTKSEGLPDGRRLVV